MCVTLWGEACRFISLAIPADAVQRAVLARASALLYSFGMPAQVIVVQRPRRSLFAVPRALPDWLRAVWAAMFRTAPSDADIARVDSTGSRSMNAPHFPKLVFDATGSHRCIGCDLCIQVCPSRCLALTTNGEGTGLQVIRFDLIRGACIGCGICGEACPEDAIEMAAGVRVELAPLSGRLEAVDLLAMRG